jgi:hypothetical protein
MFLSNKKAIAINAPLQLQLACVHDINEFCGLSIGPDGHAVYRHGYRVS